MLDDAQLFTVTDLKQFSYCGRVVFYEQCLPHVRPRTYKMDAGRARHDDEPQRAARRSLRPFTLDEDAQPAVERAFDVALTDPTLRLTGVIDEVVYTACGAPVPVDYKLTKRVHSNHKLQLAAYALLLEAATGHNVPHGYIYLIPRRRVERVPVTAARRRRVHTLLDAMYTAIAEERFPPPASQRRRCLNCEFRRFCNDV